MGLAPGHDLRPGVVAVAAQRDPGLWPVLTDALHETPDMAGDFLPEGVFAGRRMKATGLPVPVS